MPHIIVQMYPGRSEADKQQIANVIQESLSLQMDMEPNMFSVSIQEIPKNEWKDRVYDKLELAGNLIIKPGYSL